MFSLPIENDDHLFKSLKTSSWYQADESLVNGITPNLQNTKEIQAFCYLHGGMLATLWRFRGSLSSPNFDHFMPYYKLGHAGNGHISKELVIIWLRRVSESSSSSSSSLSSSSPGCEGECFRARKHEPEVEGIGMCRVAGGFSSSLLIKLWRSTFWLYFTLLYFTLLYYTGIHSSARIP